MMKKPFLFLSHSGQTSVEYILLVGVVVILATSIMGNIQEYMVGESENCTPDSTSLTCGVSRLFVSGGYSAYRYYRF